MRLYSEEEETIQSLGAIFFGTVRAAVTVMRVLVMMIVLGAASAALAGQRARLGGSEAPSATDLLRAETMAREARERLRIRKRPAAKWVRGGKGWREKTAESEPRAPVIKVYPGRRTTRARDRG